MGKHIEASEGLQGSQIALLGLPIGPLGTLTYALGKQDAHKGGYKGKKLHIAATVCNFQGGARHPVLEKIGKKHASKMMQT